MGLRPAAGTCETIAERITRAEPLIASAPAVANGPHHATTDPFAGEQGLPDIPFSDLTVDALAAGLQHHGSLVVRGVVTGDAVDALRTFADGGAERASPIAETTEATDRMVATLVAAYESNGVLELVERYLGEEPVGYPHRTLVKRNRKSPGLAWHQDASFFNGPCGALDLWTALTPCGADCPSLELVPQRVGMVIDPEQIASNHSAVVEAEVVRLLDGAKPSRPVLAPGDAILLDEMTVHRTGRRWKAPYRDVAITWFFAPSRLPRSRWKPIAL
jgi:hypothetical protein